MVTFHIEFLYNRWNDLPGEMSYENKWNYLDEDDGVINYYDDRNEYVILGRSS